MQSDRTRTYCDPTGGNGGRVGDAAAAGAAADAAGAGPQPGAALRDALGHLGELKEYALYYLGAKLDGIKVGVRNLVIYAVLGLIGAVVGATALVVTVVLLMQGLAGALSHFFSWLINPNWAWLGPFLLGLLILGGLAAGVIFGLKWFTRTAHSSLVAKYENRRRQQRNDYGHDVRERARDEEQFERAAAR